MIKSTSVPEKEETLLFNSNRYMSTLVSKIVKTVMPSVESIISSSRSPNTHHSPRTALDSLTKLVAGSEASASFSRMRSHQVGFNTSTNRMQKRLI